LSSNAPTPVVACAIVIFAWGEVLRVRPPQRLPNKFVEFVDGTEQAKL
jgi:hypothetical protein